MVDPVWAGVVGALGGAAVGAVSSLLSPLIGWRVEHKRLQFERDTKVVEAHRATVQGWRQGLAQARREYVEHERAQSANAEAPEYPGVFGSVWFESLRPHLQIEEGQYGHGWSLEPNHVTALTDEIARIEKEWGLTPPEV